MDFREEIQKLIDKCEENRKIGLYTDVDHAYHEAYEEVLELYDKCKKD